MFIFSIYIFVRFDDRTVPTGQFKFYGQTLYNVFISSFYYGLTQGGGVGDALFNLPYTKNDKNPRYWELYAVMLVWFIVVNLICVNMTMAIIIDSFGALDEENSNIEKEIISRCFICSINREVFATK